MEKSEKDVFPADEVYVAEHYKLYPSRFLFLFTLVFLCITSALLWITYSTVADIAAKKFQVGPTAVNQLSIVFYLGYLLFSLPASWIYHEKSLKLGIGLGALLTCIAAWLRYIAVAIPSMSASGAFILTIVAQSLAAIGQPFLVNSSTTFAAAWFPPTSRGSAITMISVASPLGFALGSAVIPHVCTSIETLPWTLLVIACVATVIPLPLFFLHAKPLTPPGPIARQHTQTSFIAGVYEALRAKGFWALLISFSILVGTFTSFGGLLSSMLGPEGFSNQQAGLMGALTIAGGFIGAAVTAILMDRTGKHILFLKIMLPFAGLGMLSMFIAVTLHNLNLLLAVSFFIGLTTFGLFPAALEVGVECTWPVQEGTSTGLLMMGSQTAALIIQSLMNALRAGSDAMPPYHMHGSAVFAAAAAIVAALIGLFGFNGSMRRRQAENYVQQAATETH